MRSIHITRAAQYVTPPDSSSKRCSRDEGAGYRQLQRSAELSQSQTQPFIAISTSGKVARSPGLYRSRSATRIVQECHAVKQAEHSTCTSCVHLLLPVPMKLPRE